MENNLILSDKELNLDNIVNKILLQDFDNTYHKKIVLPNGEVLNSNYGLQNCIIFNVNESNFTGKAKILGTLAIYLIVNKSNDPNKKIPFFTDMNKETYGTYFRSFSNLDVNNNPFGCIFINYHLLAQNSKLEIPRIKYLLKSVISHEARHYYDDVLGDVYTNETYIDTIDQNMYMYTDDFNEEPEIIPEILRDYNYIFQQTEMNAYTQTFYQQLNYYINDENNTNKSIEGFMNSEYSKNDYWYMLFNLKKSDLEFKHIDILCKQEGDYLTNLYYYYRALMTNLNISDNTYKTWNNLFDQNYMKNIPNLKLMSKVKRQKIKELLPTAFKAFMQQVIIPKLTPELWQKIDNMQNNVNAMLEHAFMKNKYSNKRK